jgi:tRNA-(ms[2]io[6]A)-hydroxylase
MDVLLLDLAHCEKRAASTVLSLVFRLPDEGGEELAGTLSRLAREELTHFEWCLRVLDARGVAYRRLEPSPYAGGLVSLCRKKGEEALLDAFLAASVIEARSGERLALLRDSEADPELHALFAALFPPEERHVEVLYGIACRFGDPAPRLPVLLAREAELIQAGTAGVRVHG